MGRGRGCNLRLPRTFVGLLKLQIQSLLCAVAARVRGRDRPGFSSDRSNDEWNTARPYRRSADHEFPFAGNRVVMTG